MYASAFAQVVLFLGDLMQGLIINLPIEAGPIGVAFVLVDAFGVIEFFATASLFGWLTFTVATDDVFERIQKKKKIPDDEADGLRESLYALNDYFIISFAFFALSALADYSFHHEHLFGHSYESAVMTISMFAVGAFTLILPILYLWRLERRPKETFVQRVDYALALFLVVAVSISFIFSVTAHSENGRIFSLFLSVPPLVGLWLAFRANPLRWRRTLLLFVLSVAPFLVLLTMWLLGIGWIFP